MNNKDTSLLFRLTGANVPVLNEWNDDGICLLQTNRR